MQIMSPIFNFDGSAINYTGRRSIIYDHTSLSTDQRQLGYQWLFPQHLLHSPSDLVTPIDTFKIMRESPTTCTCYVIYYESAILETVRE